MPWRDAPLGGAHGSTGLSATDPPLGSAIPVDQVESHPRRVELTWCGFLGFSAASSVLAFAGRPTLSVAMLVLGLLWAVRESIATWVYGVGLLLLTLQFVPSRIYRLPFGSSFDIDPYRLCLLGLVVVWVISSVANARFQLRATYLDTGVVLFLVALATSYLMNASLFLSGPAETKWMVKSSAYILSFPLTFYLIVGTIRDWRDALKLVDIVTLFGGVTGAFAVIERVTMFNLFFYLDRFVPMLELIAPKEQLFTGDFRAGLRTMGPTAHPIALATMLAMLLPLCVSRALYGESKTTRWRSGICAALIGTGIFMALSRTGVLGVAAGGVVLLLGFPRYRSLMVAAAVGLVGAVHAVFRGVLGTLFQYFTPSFVLSQEVGNRNGRLVDYARAFPQILNRPLFGQGFDTFSPDRFGFIDNQYLKFALEIGVVGIVAFVHLVWRAISVPFTTGRRIGGEVGAALIGLSASAAVFGVASAGFDTVGFPQVVYLFFALAALSAILVDAFSGA